jgi:Transglutaminase-like superfamily
MKRRLSWRLRSLQSNLRTPGDAWLLVRMTGWRLVLPALKFVMPMPRLVRLMARPPRSRPRDTDRERRAAGLADLLYGPVAVPLLSNCLERSLIVYRYLSAAGADPQLTIGFDPGGSDLHGHVWVVVDGAPVRESVEDLARYVPTLAYGRDGARVAVEIQPRRDASRFARTQASTAGTPRHTSQASRQT